MQNKHTDEKMVRVKMKKKFRTRAKVDNFHKRVMRAEVGTLILLSN